MRNQLPTCRWMIWTHRPASPDLVYFPRKFPKSGPLFILLHIIPILWLRSGASCKRKHWASPVYHWVPWWKYKVSMISMTHWEPWQQEDKQFSQLDDLSNLQHAQQAAHAPLASCISGLTHNRWSIQCVQPHILEIGRRLGCRPRHCLCLGTARSQYLYLCSRSMTQY